MTGMMPGTACKVYEYLASTNMAAEGIRPGGIELTRHALAYCAFPPDSRILDVGCGNGATLNLLSCAYKLSPLGIDQSFYLASQARLRNPDLLLIGASGEMLPLADESADGVFAECSLSVMDDPCAALDEFRRVLRIGGKLILSDVYARHSNGIDQLASISNGCCLRGMIPRTKILERLTIRDFRIDLWEDHSDLLKQFAVNFIFQYGSMKEFWRMSSPDPRNFEETRQIISRAKPGYFLLIATKEI